jgi:hypothetical protein
MMPNLRFVSRTSAEWSQMWHDLGELGWLIPGPDPCPACNPASGECWQYMGTLGNHHQFRHRDYPGPLSHCTPETQQVIRVMNGRVYVNVEVR